VENFSDGEPVTDFRKGGIVRLVFEEHHKKKKIMPKAPTSKKNIPQGPHAHWNITIFNEEERNAFIKLKGVVNLECYKELCPKTNKIHWQSCVQFTNKGRMRFGGLKKLLPTAHLEAWYKGKEGTPQEHWPYMRNYCKKGSQSHNEYSLDQENGVNYGKDVDPEGVTIENETHPGERTELTNGREKIQSHVSMRDVLNDPALEELCQKHMAWVERVFAAKPAQPMEEFFPRKYHKMAMEWLTRPYEPVTKETIGKPREQLLWLWEKKGNTSKTMFLKFLVSNMGALLCSNTDKENAFRYSGETILVLDVPRSRKGRVNFGVIEGLLNGFINSDKYFPLTKCYQVQPRMIVVANAPWTECSEKKTVVTGMGEPYQVDNEDYEETLSVDRVKCVEIMQEDKELLDEVWTPDTWKHAQVMQPKPVQVQADIPTVQEVVQDLKENGCLKTCSSNDKCSSTCQCICHMGVDLNNFDPNDYFNFQ